LGHGDHSDTFYVPAQALERLEAREAAPALILLAFEDCSAAWEVVAELSPESVLPHLHYLLAHPKSSVGGAANILCEEVRRRLGLPRNPLFAPPQTPKQERIERTFPARAALHTIVALVDEALALLPGWPLAIRYKAEALRRLGCPNDALVALQAADIDTGNIRHRTLCNVEQARCQRACGQRDEALTTVRRVQDEVGDDPFILTDCADLLAELGAVDEAEALHVRIIQLLNRADSYHNRAGFYIRQNRSREAEEDIIYAAKDEPWHLHTYGLRGQLALIRGRFAAALEAFKEAHRRDPHSVQWRYDIAFACLGLARDDDAIHPNSTGYSASKAPVILETALAYTELHEQVKAAVEGLDRLMQTWEDPSALEWVRQCLLEHRIRLDEMAENECRSYMAT
jgi:tetratricopeptide (TPR) repeat protein